MIENLEQRLTQVFSRVFGLDHIDDMVSVVTLEPWDSMSHITLILELESAFDVQISTDEAIEMTSVPEIRSVLTRKAGV